MKSNTVGYLQMFLPHCVQISNFRPQIFQGQITLSLPQLTRGQLLLEAGDVVLRDVLPLPLQILQLNICVKNYEIKGFTVDFSVT